MESPYDVLRIEPGVGDDEIEAAYRRRVKAAHPDRGGSLEEFQAVRTAYAKLRAGYRESRGSAERGREEDGDGPGGDWYARATADVTYLDYDVLGDFGWSISDPDLFRAAARADLPDEDYGEFDVEPGESLLEAAERHGFAWPFACRGGACANCAVLLLEGELSMPPSHVLPAELMERGFRLSCNGIPITEELQVVYNVKDLPELDELLLPPRPFEQAYLDE